MSRTVDLDFERKKLLWLRDKLAAQEELVGRLEQLAADDPLDELFLKETARKTQQATPVMIVQASPHPQVERDVEGDLPQDQPPSPLATPQWQAWTRQPRRMASHWAGILKFIGEDGKNAGQVKAFIEQHFKFLSWDSARSGLMAYRRDFGLLESSRRGHYRLTEKGAALLGALEDESPANDGEALESQPTREEVTHTA
jgi:hypothetical protein